MQLRDLLPGMGMMLWLACATAGFCEPEEKPLPENGRMTLALPPSLKAPDTVNLKVTVGVLPKGARILVRSKDGQDLGAITPFGQAANREGVFYTIPVPAELLSDGRVTIEFQLEEKAGKGRRAPTDAEIREAHLEAKR